MVVVYRRSHGGTVWEGVRVIGGGFRGPGSRDGQLHRAYGLRFSRSSVVVADTRNSRASVFRVDDGVFVRHMATGLSSPWDVEEVEGGWLVACGGSHAVEFVSDGVGGDGGGRPSLGKAGEFNGPNALAVVPGLGQVVREWGNDRLQVFG